MVEGGLLWVANNFSHSAASWSLKIEAILWAGIDIFLVYNFLRIFGIARARRSKRPIIIRYILLWSTVILTLALPFCDAIFILAIIDFAVISVHLAIMVYTLFVDGKSAFTMLRALVIKAKASVGG